MRTRIMRRYGGFDESFRIVADSVLMKRWHKDALSIMFVNDWYADYAGGGLSERAVVEFQREARRASELVFGGFHGPVRMFFRYLRYCVHPDVTLRIDARHLLKVIGLAAIRAALRVGRKSAK